MSRTGKAIKITKDNVQSLTEQHNLEEDYLEDANGLWLIAGFGEDSRYQGLLTDKGLERTYTKTGKTLLNGYIEVERADGGPV